MLQLCFPYSVAEVWLPRKFKNWPRFVFIYFNTSTFQREKATTEKVSSGFLLSSAGEVLGISGAHPEVGIGQVRVMQFS